MIELNRWLKKAATVKYINKMVVFFVVLGAFFLILMKSNNSSARNQANNLNAKDSLQRLNKLLAKSEPDTNRVKYLIKIANHFISQKENKRTNLAKALPYLQKALRLSDELKSLNWEFRSLMIYASFLNKKHLRVQQAFTYEKAIALAKKIGNKHLEASAWYSYYVNIPDTVSDYKNKTFYNRAATAHALYKEVGTSFDEKYREATLLKTMADFHLEEEKFDLAIQELYEVIALDKKFKLPDLPMAYDLLSAVYERKGELSKALNYALLSVKTAQSHHEEVLGTYLNRVGSAYEAMGKARESIIWYSKTLNGQDKKDPYRFITAYAITSQMIKLGEAKKALSILEKTWNEVGNPSSGHQYFMFLAFGECYAALKKYDLAKNYFDKLLDDATLKTYSNPFQTSVFFSVSEFYFAQNKYELALQFAEKARENQISMTLPRQIRLNEILYKIDVSTSRPAEAIIHLQTFHKLRDSMLSQDNLNTIERLKIEFQASQKENENEILRKKSQLQSQELNRIQWIKNVTVAGLAFLTIVLVLIYGRFRLKKKLHDTLVKKKADIDLAYAELEINVQQKNKLIEEKESLIKEVHHRVKNNLQLTMSLLNSQSYYLEDLSAIEAIKESQHRLKSIALIHQKLYQTENVATINIQPYIIELIEYLKESLNDDKKISFDLNILNLELDISKAVPLGLIINEAITNIFKYAFPDGHGGKVIITLKECQADHYQLFIKDNGIGLPADFDYEQSNTLGIILMKGLSAQIDGVFTMESKNGVSLSLTFMNRNEDLFPLKD
ncbi:two-component sensor histidine kinase [Pedobacter sp. W3I1]|uniref:tetratricopeptide repeat-containing sensor histidine kinase n=1 Tax=Pedobacter sp. W3I1 TaxID=3042291 RepID=UPI002785F118|nr:histidine kinase dimerization/phosphoacceptor domain -containing protein [Pedobacter sp. W3I1]MDQ0640029.1 two-component sensor histidine kinase [Pedobacter sp. W3I1]